MKLALFAGAAILTLAGALGAAASNSPDSMAEWRDNPRLALAQWLEADAPRARSLMAGAMQICANVQATPAWTNAAARDLAVEASVQLIGHNLKGAAGEARAALMAGQAGQRLKALSGADAKAFQDIAARTLGEPAAASCLSRQIADSVAATLS